MNFFNFDIKKILVLGVLTAIPLFSVNMQQKTKDRPWMLEPFYFAAGVTQNSFATFSSGVRGTTRTYLDLIGIKNENEQLKKSLSELQAKLSSMTELQLENERLNKLLDFQKSSKSDLLAARVIGRDLISGYQTITIDKGTKDGVQKGMATVTINGVVGYILNPDTATSQILLLTDTYAVIDALVQRSRVRGILIGQTSTSCKLSHLNRNDDVQIGDQIVTSGLDNVFPKGFPIGKVISLKSDAYGLGQDVEVEPVVNPSNLEELFVIRRAKDEGLLPDQPSESDKTTADKVVKQ